MSGITVKNNSGTAVDVFVTKFGGGSDEWYAVKSRGQDSWGRTSGSWNLVAFKVGSERAGVYVQAGSVVVFRSFKNITVLKVRGPRQHGFLSLLNAPSD